MALLDATAVAVLAAVAVSACYQPTLVDCTITCASSGECASGQVCGDDGFCARPEIAGSCATLGMIDAAQGAIPDARETADARRPPDARPDARPDAMPPGVLRIAITGRGKVTANPGDHTCNAPDDGGATCSYAITVGTVMSLDAKAGKDRRFVGWTTPVCAGQDDPCTLVIATGTTIVGAAFGAD